MPSKKICLDDFISVIDFVEMHVNYTAMCRKDMKEKYDLYIKKYSSLLKKRKKWDKEDEIENV